MPTETVFCLESFVAKDSCMMDIQYSEYKQGSCEKLMRRGSEVVVSVECLLGWFLFQMEVRIAVGCRMSASYQRIIPGTV